MPIAAEPQRERAVSAAAAKRAASDNDERAELVYILAASHSGSTLLAMLLGAHPEICTAGELKATNLGNPDEYRCSCGTLIKRCEFWRAVSENMARRGFDFDVTDARTNLGSIRSRYVQKLLRPLHRGPWLERARDAALRLSPAWRREFPALCRRNSALVRAIRDVSGKRIVVDSSKIGLRLKYLLRDPTLNVKVIRLIRDGRAVALTYMNPAEYADASDPHLRGGGMGGDRAGERMSMSRAAREWRRSNEEAEAVTARLIAGRVMQIHYEALCDSPGAELRRVAGFLKIDRAQFPAGFRSVEQHVVGNGMRLDATAEVRLDDRWKRVLSAEGRRGFDAVASDTNRRYGYA